MQHNIREILALTSRLILVCLPSLLFFPGLSGHLQGDTIHFGGDGGLSWKEGGGHIAPVFIVGPQEVDSGNTPGGVINFAFRENVTRFCYSETFIFLQNLYFCKI